MTIAQDIAGAGLPTRPAPLTRADRCDRCSAAARVRALMTFGELLFCGHHARAFRAGLADAGAVILPGR